MNHAKQFGILTTLLTLLISGATLLARADSATDPKGPRILAAFWTLPKEDGKVSLIVAGQKDPVTVAVSDATVFAGICLDCTLPLEFKPGEAAKNCNVCGCAVSNAACIVGRPIKPATWQGMLKQLPHGVVLSPTYNEADKPESGLKRLQIDLRAVLLPVTGLEGQTPDQLLALAKPLGATKAELIDGGKLLSLTLKSDWTAERETKLEKALTALNAKISVPEEPKAGQ
jgi:hypothetical protein